MPDVIAISDLRFPAPKHLSHSSRETLLRCAKSWFLKYMTPAPRTPALWLAGGSAVHEVTEAWDRASLNGELEFWRDIESVWQVAFDAQLAELRRKEPNEWNWRRSRSEPIERWNINGPQFVQSYIDWRQRSPYTIWTTPDGDPAIELDVSGHLPGCPVEIKGYVDRIFHDPVMDQLVIVDLKTGKRPPKNPDQFAAYAALVSAKWPEAVPALGAPFMNRLGTLGAPYVLPGYTPDSIGEVFADAWKQIQSGEFPADTSDCFLCDVSAACAAKNGPLARLYDPDAEGYEVPPF